MFPLDPNIPFPIIPDSLLPDSGGCFGTLAFYTFSWDSTKPDITSFGFSSIAVGGGVTACYKITCDGCLKGGPAGPPSFGFSSPLMPNDFLKIASFARGFGFAGTISGDSVCITVGIFGGPSPFFIGAPIADF